MFYNYRHEVLSTPPPQPKEDKMKLDLWCFSNRPISYGNIRLTILNIQQSLSTQMAMPRSSKQQMPAFFFSFFFWDKGSNRQMLYETCTIVK